MVIRVIVLLSRQLFYLFSATALSMSSWRLSSDEKLNPLSSSVTARPYCQLRKNLHLFKTRLNGGWDRLRGDQHCRQVNIWLHLQPVWHLT
jgi:hypothetical protein